MTEETPGATTGSRQRRKRKWDQPAALVSTPGAWHGALPFSATGLGAFSGVPPYMNFFPNLSTVAAQGGVIQGTTAAAAQHNAAAIVQKFNQDLLASKGILLQSKIQDELIAREITINDAEPGVRYRLTKRQTQEEIQMKTGAVVITRGRYRPPNGPVDHEKPLYLHISAGVNLKDTAERIKAVDQAAAMVEEMLKQGQQTQVPAARSSVTGNPLNGTVQIPVTFNVFVGFEADPSFNLVGRIRGPNNQYLSHITTETGASVVLRGKGSGNAEGSAAEESQPLHLFISGDNAKSVEDAKVLAQNLLETIRADWLPNRLQTYQPLPSVVPVVFPPKMVTYPMSQPPPYSANLPQNPYGAYYPTVGGAFPTPYATGHAPPPPTFAPETVAVSSERTAPALVNPYASMPPPSKPPSKVYGAVPPPTQLLADKPTELDKAAEDSVDRGANVRLRERFSQSSTSSDSNVFAPSIVSAPSSTSYVENSPLRGGLSASSTYGSSSQNLQQPVTSLPVNRVNESQVSQSVTIGSLGQLSATTSQVLATSQIQAAANPSYSGYGGIYPDVSPFQQVAQALQRPPLPVSVRPVPHSALMATLTKAQSSSFQEKQSEKQPGQRRKFQEYRIIASNDSAGDEQQGRRGATSAGLEASMASRDQGSTSNSVTIASREMPPPPVPSKSYSFAPKRTASSTGLSAAVMSTGVKSAEKHDASPGTGLKLVEYGEEEDVYPGSTTPVPPKPFSNGKPFWAA